MKSVFPIAIGIAAGMYISYMAPKAWSQLHSSPVVESSRVGVHYPYYDLMREMYLKMDVKGKDVYAGHSIIQLTDLAAALNNTNVVNRGICGDHAEGLDLRINDYQQANSITVMIGINDLMEWVPLEETERYTKSVLKKCGSKATYLLTLPVVSTWKNKWITGEVLNKRVDSFNIDMTKFCQENKIPVKSFPFGNSLDPAYSTDGVHLSERGYKVFTAALK